MILNLEPQELSLLIAALKALIAAQPLTAFVLEPLVKKLENPPPVIEATRVASRAWTESEDAVIRKYSEIMVPPVWSSIQKDLPDRTINMIKSRYARLGLAPKAVTIPPGTFKEPLTGPIGNDPTGYPGPLAEIDMGPTKEYVDQQHPAPASDPLAITPGTEPKPPAEPAPASMPVPDEPKATLANTESTKGWSPRLPTIAEMMKGR